MKYRLEVNMEMNLFSAGSSSARSIPLSGDNVRKYYYLLIVN
jgi:hypothetical protein